MRESLPIKSMLILVILLTLICSHAIMNLLPVFAQSTGTISGRVTNLKTGSGIAGAAVSAVGPSEQAEITDSQGYYIISGLAPGPYTIEVSALGYLSESISSFFVYPDNNPPPPFTLNMLSITGRVCNASMPDIGVSEANITIEDHYIIADSSGCYEWLDLLDGTYIVTASAPGYGSQSKLVTVSTGTTSVSDFALSSILPGRITGTIKDASTRQGLDQATVRISRGSYEKLQNTDPSGQYSLENVPAWSSWSVEIYKVGYVAQSTIVAVQPEDTIILNTELEPFGTVCGTVKDQSTNQPLVGAIVKADSEFLNTTDSNGYYTMFVIGRTQDYTITASSPGYASSSQSVKVSAGETCTISFSLQAVQPGRIIGLIKDAKTGHGIPDAVVTADGYSNTTDTNGNYALSNVPAWTYTVSVTVPGFVGSGTQRTVPSGGLVTADFTLNPDTQVSLDPYLNFGDPEELFSVDLCLSDSRFVYSWEIYLWWNPALLQATSLDEGSFLKGPFGNRTTDFSFDEYVNEGVIHAKCQSTLSVPDSGVSGGGTLATLTLQIKATGSCSINVTSALLSNTQLLIPKENAIFRTLQGDVNNDLIVNGTDLVCLKEAYGAKLGDVHWNVDADVNRDQTVSAIDLHKIGKDYGKSV